MTKRSLRTLYRHAKQGDLTAQVELDNNKKVQLDKFVERYERLSLILEYRNLTLSEAHLLYTSGVKVAALSPHHDTDSSASERNYKSSMVRSYVNKHPWCPCCKGDMPANRAVWYVKEGFIAKGFLKICAGCKLRPTRGQCISVYYDEFMAVSSVLGRDFTVLVYKVYLDRGVVFDRTSKRKQSIANYAMREAIKSPDDRAARDKDMEEYEQKNCSW